MTISDPLPLLSPASFFKILGDQLMGQFIWFIYVNPRWQGNLLDIKAKYQLIWPINNTIPNSLHKSFLLGKLRLVPVPAAPWTELPDEQAPVILWKVSDSLSNFLVIRLLFRLQVLYWISVSWLGCKCWSGFILRMTWVSQMTTSPSWSSSSMSSTGVSRISFVKAKYKKRTIWFKSGWYSIQYWLFF